MSWFWGFLFIQYDLRYSISVDMYVCKSVCGMTLEHTCKFDHNMISPIVAVKMCFKNIFFEKSGIQEKFPITYKRIAKQNVHVLNLKKYETSFAFL